MNAPHIVKIVCSHGGDPKPDGRPMRRSTIRVVIAEGYTPDDGSDRHTWPCRRCGRVKRLSLTNWAKLVDARVEVVDICDLP